MGLFKKKTKTSTSSESRALNNLVTKEFTNMDLPVNQNDRLKCIYYKEF